MSYNNNVKNRCDMNEELFGELHEQEEYGLFGKEHERQQCFLHSVSGRSEQLVCPSCDSQVIVSDERHNVKMCGVCKNQWAN